MGTPAVDHLIGFLIGSPDSSAARRRPCSGLTAAAGDLASSRRLPISFGSLSCISAVPTRSLRSLRAPCALTRLRSAPWVRASSPPSFR